MDHAWTGYGDARAGAPSQIAVSLRRVGGGLLVAHTDIGDAFLLGGRGDRGDRKPDDPKQVINALLLEAPRDQGSAVHLTHAFPPCDQTTWAARLRIDGRAAKEVNLIQTTKSD